MFKSVPDYTKYGVIVAAAIWFVGWSTGLGGSFLPNLLFAILMGLFAGLCFWLVKRFWGQDR